jgi:hypothetical protein
MPVGGPVIGPGMTGLEKVTRDYWTLVQRIRRLAVPGRDKVRRQVSDMSLPSCPAGGASWPRDKRMHQLARVRIGSPAGLATLLPQ